MRSLASATFMSYHIAGGLLVSEKELMKHEHAICPEWI